MSREQNETGWDKESAVATFARSMGLIRRCIEKTEQFLDSRVDDLSEFTAETWDYTKTVVKELEIALQEEPEKLGRNQFALVKRLFAAINKLDEFLCGNPAEMVKLANQLAVLNEKTLGIQVTIEKAYGALEEKHRYDVLEDLDPAQIAQVYEWVEQNREFKRVMGNG